MAAAINSTAKLNSKFSKFHFTWSVPYNGSDILHNNDISHLLTESTSFKTSNDTEWSWQCVRKEVDGFVYYGLRIIYDSDDYTPTKVVEFKFVLVGSHGTRILNGFTHKIFERNNATHYTNTGIEVSDFIPSPLHEFGDLTVVCTIRDAAYFPIPPCQLQHDLNTFLNDQQFTDVTLVVDGQPLKAHKAFLASRSPVFAAMFTSDMLERRQDQVIIPDMEYKVAQHLLQFMYTGKTEIAPDVAEGLLLAADKYGLMRLKAQCEEHICSAITTTTAVKTLIFADRINAEHLKSNTMGFIKANSKKVVESDDWKSMVEYPTLLNEVCIYLASN